MALRDMKKSAAIAFGIAMLTAATGCAPDLSDLSALTVSQLGQKLAESPATVVCDANGEGIRESYGIIPGAVLVSSSSSYDVALELPSEKDKPLVFYCSSERCSAAPAAARRAKAAGYTDVYVLPEGIKGWVAAGKPVAKSTS
jgi:rhodanese-related sulfurtransferase